jgi:hypothetical protein
VEAPCGEESWAWTLDQATERDRSRVMAPAWTGETVATWAGRRTGVSRAFISLAFWLTKLLVSSRLSRRDVLACLSLTSLDSRR